MNKNTIIGLIFIGLALLAFTWINRPKKGAESPKIETENIAQASAPAPNTVDTTLHSSSNFFHHRQQITGTEQTFSLENNKIKIDISSLGALPVTATLKDYNSLNEKTKKQAVALFKSREDFNLNFIFRTSQRGVLDTKDLYFEKVANTDSTLTLRLAIDSLSYIDFTYTLRKDNYLVDLCLTRKGLDKVFPNNMRYLDFELKQRMPQLEKSWVNENNYTNLYWKYVGDNVEHFNATSKNKTKDLSGSLSWIGFKGKFFANTLIADKNNPFEDVRLQQTTFQKDNPYLKDFSASGSVPFDLREGSSTRFTFFMGPLDLHLFKEYGKKDPVLKDLHLEKMVYVGKSLFRWINIHLIRPVVDFLSTYISNWGIIILLLTLIIKLVLSPLTFKSYMSQAKMRVLKPQVEEINLKYPGKDQNMQLKRSQETMALYKSVGASPMAGCLPMILQMPFLIALYMYFPTSIDLRDTSFLWAEDLSSYDAILSWNFDIPILSGLMGNHISLFCLLWAITNVIYSRYTMSQSATGQENSQMKMMQWMPYMMSIMFFFFFNQNSSGLCYYYFISTLITILQYIAGRLIINEEKVLAKLEENKKKPRKKSGFMARLEEAQRLQQQRLREQQGKQRR